MNAHVTTMPAVPHPRPTEPTMTTKEIADRTGKKNHNVMRDVRRIELALGGGALRSEATYRDEQGKELPCYRLDRRAILILTSGYSIRLRAAVIDRLDELERAAAAPASLAIPTTFAEALRLAADSAEESDRQRALADERQKLIEAQAPAVAMVATFSAEASDKSIQSVARDLRILPLNKLFAILEAKRWIFRKPSSRKGPGRWQATAQAIKLGFLKHDVFHIAKPDGGSDESLSVVVTAKGQALIQQSLVNVQLDLMIDMEGKASDAA